MSKPYGWKPEPFHAPVYVPPAPWPAPEVPCRPATSDEVPRGAKSLLKAAETHDWEILRCTYAKGTLPTKGLQWEPGGVVESLVLGGTKGDLTFVASWVAGSYSLGYVASKSRGQMTAVKSTELRAVLVGELS